MDHVKICRDDFLNVCTHGPCQDTNFTSALLKHLNTGLKTYLACKFETLIETYQQSCLIVEPHKI